MKIDSLTIKGFRCFDDVGQTISLDDLTCFIGPNASGKTASMIALVRMFGESHTQRQVINRDFHLKVGEKLKDNPTRVLSIECRVKFPELEQPGEEDTSDVPEVFNQMIIDEPQGELYCRIRLEATWTDDGTSSGEIEQSMYWILSSPKDAGNTKDDHKRRLKPVDRGKIRVIYVPAARDPENQIRFTTATTFGRLLDSISWGEVADSAKEKLNELQTQLNRLVGIQTMNSQVQTSWNRLYNGRIAKDMMFRALEEDPSSLMNLLIPTFSPGESGGTLLTSDLSDGLRSLFSLSLSLGLFEVEESLRVNPTDKGFKGESQNGLPILTLFAIEEPENHMSPHYLGRIVAESKRVSLKDRGQVVLSSHSPSILSRIEPDNVRYFLSNESLSAAKVMNIPLPKNSVDEAFKYVREAVKGHPELYFSKLVLLGEGASEEIVLRKILESMDVHLDISFISVVPLGGRHVNHFWRLLHGTYPETSPAG